MAGPEGFDAGAPRERLRPEAPEHRVPGAFVRLEPLPLTSTGRFDPRTLPPPDCAGAAVAVAPRDDLERSVAEHPAAEEPRGAESLVQSRSRAEPRHTLRQPVGGR